VARAKRTNRAEARRRYRAQIAEQPDAETPETAEQPVEPSARGPRAPRGPRPAAEPQRSGMRYAFRAAFREPNIREDIEHLPELLRSRAIFLPVLISVGTAVAIAATSGTDVISRLLAQYFLVPPPIGSIFIAGFFAPRASYLAGLIVGLVAAIALTVLIAVTPTLGTGVTGPAASASPSAATSPAAGSPSASASAAPSASAAASASPSSAASAGASPAASGAGTPLTQNPADVAGFALLASPIAGIFFASAAAWYRRFLQLSNPNRAAARGGQKARPNNRRR
jgi:hypothetical protein